MGYDKTHDNVNLLINVKDIVDNLENKDISPPPNQTDVTFEENFFDEGSPDKSQDNSINEGLEVNTDTLFEEGTEKLNDFNHVFSDNIYIEIPKVNLSNVIASNREIHNALEESWEEQLVPIGDHKADFSFPDSEYTTFKTSAQKEVNYLVKEFESRKAADAYARAETGRTGK